MSDTEKKFMMFLNMDFRMTISIPFLFFCLCMSKIFTIYLFFLQNCANVTLQVQTCSESYHGCFFSVN